MLYTNLKHFDSVAIVIRNQPEISGFMGIPFTIYYKNGRVVKATSSIQTMDQVKVIPDSEKCIKTF
jgi:thioredoxin 1